MDAAKVGDFSRLHQVERADPALDEVASDDAFAIAENSIVV